MSLPATLLLYLEDDRCFESDAMVLAVREDAVAFDRTCFYPGGGGQPPDQGWARLASGDLLEIVSVNADADDIVWHICASQPPAGILGRPARLRINAERREALARYHTALHVLNTIALRDYGGWITGVQIEAGYSRIDFKLADLSPALCAELENKANAVLGDNLPVAAYTVTEEEYRRRPDLLRTLTVQPPVHGGQVRVVEIQGFDAQACGGTHVRATGEVGRLSIYRTENKGKVNKRLYIRLQPWPAGCAHAAALHESR
jgi:misacylated tRNA(Ala) deacylase